MKLDLGSSSSVRKGYIGIDITPGTDLQWDLRWGIPFQNDSVEEIRSDHFFEHLNIDELLFVLSECYRVFKKSRKLDFTAPHVNPYLSAYMKSDIKFLRKKITDVPKKYIKIYNNPFDLVMWLIYRNGEHKSFFDQESILSKLKCAGFKNVSLRKYNRKIGINKRFSSIYVVAIK